MAKASKPSQQQVELLHHTLGLSIDHRESYPEQTSTMMR